MEGYETVVVRRQRSRTLPIVFIVRFYNILNTLELNQFSS